MNPLIILALFCLMLALLEATYRGLDLLEKKWRHYRTSHKKKRSPERP